MLPGPANSCRCGAALLPLSRGGSPGWASSMSTRVARPHEDRSDESEEPGQDESYYGFTAAGHAAQVAAATQRHYQPSFQEEDSHRARVIPFCSACGTKCHESQRLAAESCVWAAVSAAAVAGLCAWAIAATPEGTGLDCEWGRGASTSPAAVYGRQPALSVEPGLAAAAVGASPAVFGALGALQALLLATVSIRQLKIHWRLRGKLDAAREAGLAVDIEDLDAPGCLSGRIACSPVCVLSLAGVVAAILAAVAGALMRGPRTTAAYGLGAVATGEALFNATRGRTADGAADPACTLLPWLLDEAAGSDAFAGPSLTVTLRSPEGELGRMVLRAVLAPVTSFRNASVSDRELAVVAWWALSSAANERLPSGLLGCRETTAGQDLLCPPLGRAVAAENECPGPTVAGVGQPLCGALFRGGGLSDPLLSGVSPQTLAAAKQELAASLHDAGVLLLSDASLVVGNGASLATQLATRWQVVRVFRWIGPATVVVALLLATALRSGWVARTTSPYRLHQVVEPGISRIPSVQRCCCGQAATLPVQAPPATALGRAVASEAGAPAGASV